MTRSRPIDPKRDYITHVAYHDNSLTVYGPIPANHDLDDDETADLLAQDGDIEVVGGFHLRTLCGRCGEPAVKPFVNSWKVWKEAAS